MRNAKEPTKLAELTASKCIKNAIDFIYIRPKDIDIENQIVKGQKFTGDQWKEIESDIPDFIDVTPYCYKKKNRRVMNFLSKHSFLSYQPLKYGTNKIKESLKEDEPFLQQIAIKGNRRKQFEYFKKFIDESKDVIIFLSKEKSAPYIIHNQEEDKYVIERLSQITTYNEKELKTLFQSVISNENYKIYKYFPFDDQARLHRIDLQKNGEGEWNLVNSSLIEDLNGLHRKMNTNNNESKLLSEKAINTSIMLAKKIEEITKSNLMILSFDVAVSKQDKIYFYEILFGPSTTLFEHKSAAYRMSYYSYFKKNKVSNQASIETGAKNVDHKKKFTRLLNLIQRV